MEAILFFSILYIDLICDLLFLRIASEQLTRLEEGERNGKLKKHLTHLKWIAGSKIHKSYWGEKSPEEVFFFKK